MRNLSKGGKIVFRASVILIVLIMCHAHAQPPHVILPSGKKVTGTSVKVDKSGQILLTTAQGLLTFPKGTTVVVSKPSGYTRAMQMMQQKQHDAAIKALNKIIEEYRFLEWDKKAKVLLARVYVKKADYRNAMKTYAEVFEEMPEVLDDEGVRESYLKALMGSKDYDKLKPLLDETVARSSRSLAARAQMARGGLSFKAGEFEKALYDYMRTAELFKSEKNLQAEAHYKTGECLERLGDQRAAEFYEHVVREYPESPFAVKARQRQQ